MRYGTVSLPREGTGQQHIHKGIGTNRDSLRRTCIQRLALDSYCPASACVRRFVLSVRVSSRCGGLPAELTVSLLDPGDFDPADCQLDIVERVLDDLLCCAPPVVFHIAVLQTVSLVAFVPRVYVRVVSREDPAEVWIGWGKGWTDEHRIASRVRRTRRDRSGASLGCAL